MPGIAIKYWAFQQTGWGHVDDTPIPPPVPQPEIQPSRSDYQDWKWIGVPSQPIELIKPPIARIEPRILTLLQFYAYTTTKFELNFRTQERLPFASQDDSIVFCEHISPIFAAKNFRDYFSYSIGVPGQHTSQPLFTLDHLPLFGYEHQENIILHHRWVDKYREGNVWPSLPLSLSVNLRERHEYQTKSTVPLPWHIRTPILEYVRWHTPLTISLPNDIDDETLLAALAHIIIEIEENER